MNRVTITILPRERIAGYIADSLGAQLNAKPDSVLGMTTGTTPLTTGLYKEMIRREQAGTLDFSQAVMINPDEQLNIAQAHPESYHSYMKVHLLNHLSRQPAAWYIPDGMTDKPELECRRMEQAIEAHGGVDWQLMGLGINGHICFIEPGPAIPARCYVTPIAEISRRLYAPSFGSLEAVPTHAITYGMRTALACRTIKMVAVGEGKADIVAKALTDPITSELPAAFLQLHPDTEYIIDPAAASRLPDDAYAYCEVRRIDTEGEAK